MREIKYTARFHRDYKREKSGRHRKKLDAMLMEVVNCSWPTLSCRTGISIIRCLANGAITGTVTSGPTSFSSTASRMMTALNLCALAHTASLASETWGKNFWTFRALPFVNTEVVA